MTGCIADIEDPAELRIALEKRRAHLLDEIRTREDQIFIIDHELDGITGSLEGTISIALLQTQRMAAGCPPRRIRCILNRVEPYNPEQEKQAAINGVLEKIESYVNDNAPWLPGTDDRVVDARKFIAYLRKLRTSGGKQA